MTDNNKHKVVRIAITSLIFVFFGLVFLPFITPILMAALFAFAMDPLVSRYGLRSSKRRAPTLIILSIFFAIVALPVVTISVRVINKMRHFSLEAWKDTPIYHAVEGLLAQALDFAQTMGLNISQEELGSPAGLLSTVGSWLVTGATAMASQAPQLILGLFVFSCALFFFLTESKNIRKAFEKLDLLTRTEVKQIVNVVQRTSYITLVSTAIIGTIQAAIVTTGAWITGFHEVLIVFILTLITSFIPVIGAAPVAFILSGLCFISSDVKGGVIMVVVGVITGSIDNIIKPLILSADEEELNPVISLLAIIGAIIIYGIPGLLLGPILTRLAFKIIPILFPLKEHRQNS